MNKALMICDKNEKYRLKNFASEFIKFCSYENRQMGVKDVLRDNKIEDVAKLNKRHYSSPKQ